MWARLSIVAGLVVGVAVAGLVLGGILALAPDPPPPSAPAPTVLATSIPSPTVSAAPSTSAAPSVSAAPSTSAGPSASAGDPPFHIGEAAAVFADGLGATFPTGLDQDGAAQRAWHAIAALGRIRPGVDVKP